MPHQCVRNLRYPWDQGVASNPTEVLVHRKMLRLTRERVCETWEQIFCPACILLLFQAIYVLVHHWGVIAIFFFLTGTQFIGSRLEYTRSIDTRASPGKICQCEVQYIVFILVHNKTL